MARTGMNFTKPELVAIGLAVFKALGRPPARDDFLLESREKLELITGISPLPSTYHFQKEFGTWRNFLDTCGILDKSGNDINKIERAAMKHVIDELGVTEELSERSVIDGWLPNGDAVEVKGSILRKHEATGQHFFGFRIHGREISAACEKLILVGLSKDLKPIVRLEIPKEALPTVADRRSNATVYAGAVWGVGNSKYKRYIVWAEKNSLQGAIDQWSAGLPKGRSEE